MVSQLLRCHGSLGTGEGVRRQHCVLCRDYRRAHRGMDVSFRCYPSLSPSQDLDVHPAVRPGATEELPGQQPWHRGSRTYYAQDPQRQHGSQRQHQRAREASQDLSPLSPQEERPVPRCLSGTSTQCEVQPELIHLPPGP